MDRIDGEMNGISIDLYQNRFDTIPSILLIILFILSKSET